MLELLNIRKRFPSKALPLQLSLLLSLILLFFSTACERQDPTITLVPSAVAPNPLSTQPLGAAGGQQNRANVLQPTPTLVATATPLPAYVGL